jgi:hypothetical protein
MARTTLEAIRDALDRLGLVLRGGFHPEPADLVPPLPDGRPAGTVLVVGNVGSTFWARLEASPEARGPDPIDRWSARVLRELAAGHGADVRFPFDDPPHPFQRWARRADLELAPSPLGLLIHPDHGPWHALRGAFLLPERLALPERRPVRPSPCESCAMKPCLARCPVGAFTPAGYDVGVCRAYLATPSGQACVVQGCRARDACPVGRAHRYAGAQLRHHMRAFARR